MGRHTGLNIFGMLTIPRKIVFLLVYAKKAFNQINQIRMLWTVYHLCTSIDSFVLNCYCHHSLIVMINGDGKSNIIHSREAVTQGRDWIWLLQSLEYFR